MTEKNKNQKKNQKQNQSEWWRHASIYQIYPISYQDSTGNGKGDLKGITKRLPYIRSLGVDAIWISPFFKSPMKDFGYDISDYKDVDPSFGTLKDFDALVKKAHSLKLKVIIDQVVSHTSDQHPWFVESRQSRTKDKMNKKPDWYVWADPKADGNPPNNWLSIFGGSAWQWDTSREQYYLHNFLNSQPDLNFHNPEVQKAILDVMKFWLDRGVDGFRLDTVNFYFHDQKLRNNPPKKDRTKCHDNLVNPYTYQEHLYDKSQKENLAFTKKIRKLMDKYPESYIVGEVGDDNSLGIISEYTRGNDNLHTCYGFDFLKSSFSPEYCQSIIEQAEKTVKDGWMVWAFSNHDCMRAISRWYPEKYHNQQNMRKKFGQMLLVFLSNLKGTNCIYQGEELGLNEADIPLEKMKDPYGITMYPKFKGRDGCRTPMVWENKKTGGFSKTDQTWLPIPKEHFKLSVENQEKDKNSLLNFYRDYLKHKKNSLEKFQGGITSKVINGAFVIIRTDQQNKKQVRLISIFNFNDSKIEVKRNDAIFKPINKNQPQELENMIKQAPFKNGVKLQEKNIEIKPFGFIQIEI